MSIYTDYIGIPFEYNGRTKKLDCYGLVMLLYKNLKGIDLPDVLISPEYLKDVEAVVNAEKLKWTPCEIKEGAVLVFSIMGYGSHVAYVIGPDRMIHTWESTGGVTIERISPSWKHRILGCYEYV